MSTFPHFMILLFFLASPHFQPQSSAAVKIVIDGACKAQCDKNRKFWHRDEAFEFDCKTNYPNTKEAEKCRLDCETCLPEVCDEFDDANKFKCPPVGFTDDDVQKPCKERCDRNRPEGHRESFELTCSNDVSDDKDNDKCYTCEDGTCPFFVCERDHNYNSNYYCPGVPFDGVCQQRCDRNRKIGQVGPYELECGNQNDASNCRSECDRCPSFVCSRSSSFPGSGSRYFCPTPLVNTECQEICNKLRVYYNDDSYTYRCERHFDHYTCNDYCNKCPQFVCQKSSEDFIFYCPKKEQQNIWNYNPPKTLSYKGRCKDRCDRSRGGGPKEYELKCKKRYESEEEIDLCLSDCENECPNHCSHNYSGDLVIKCKADQKEVDRLEKERQDEIDTLKADHAQKRHRLVIALIIFGVILVALIGAFVAYICYIRRKYKTGPVPYAYTSAVTVNNQQQQMQYMPANAQILQRQQENVQNANLKAPPPQYQMETSSLSSASTPTFQQYQGPVPPSMAKSTPALPPASPPHPPATPSPQHAPPHPPPVTEPPKNQPKRPSPPEPPKPTVTNRQSVPVVNPTQNKPK